MPVAEHFLPSVVEDLGTIIRVIVAPDVFKVAFSFHDSANQT